MPHHLPTHLQEIGTGTEQTSDEFDFRGGRMFYAVPGIAGSSDVWELELKIGENWVKVSNAAIGASTPSQAVYMPAGRFRLKRTSDNSSNDVTKYWCYVPRSLADVVTLGG